MSRCFPFPPPNYRKEDTALIESIKLAKEKRKRSGREKNERKEKRARSNGKHDKLEDNEPSLKKLKQDDRNELPKSSCPKSTVTDVVEQLEKSGLTEEHELLYSAPELCESPESTQNSSKSSKVEAAGTGHGGNGSTILRFRLPLRKHKDLQTEQALVNQALHFSCRTVPNGARAKSAYEEPCFSGRIGLGVPETLAANGRPCVSDSTTLKGQETKLANGRPCFLGRDVLKVPEAASTNLRPHFSGRTVVNVPDETLANAMPLFSGRTVGKVLEATPANGKLCRTIPKVPKTKLANERLLLSGRTTSRVSEATPSKDNTLKFSVRPASRVSEASLAREVPSVSEGTAKLVEATPAAVVPESAGPVAQALSEVKLGEDARDESGDRGKRSRRKEKLERRFRDLTVNWAPPPSSDVNGSSSDDDLGWLLGNRRSCSANSDAAKSCVFTSSSSDEPTLGKSDVSSFQPRAGFLPELDMYLLPYVVPF